MITFEEWYTYEMRRRRERPFTCPTERRFVEWCLQCGKECPCGNYEHYRSRLHGEQSFVEKVILTRIKVA